MINIKRPTNIKNPNSNNQIRFKSTRKRLKIRSDMKQIITKKSIDKRLG